MDNNIVCVEFDNSATYPSRDYFPSERYPEYPFSDVSTDKNQVYSLVRATLRDLGLDRKHYGTVSWNPLGDLLKPGQKVVIKPNLVMHENENTAVKENPMECLVTHPSCIKAIIDYCVIALKSEDGTDGTIDGEIVIADAPMQGCKFDVLIKKMHFDTMIEYYKKHGVIISFKDLRQYETRYNAQKVITGKKYTDSKGITVHLGKKSMHCNSGCNGQYRVSDYDKRITQQFHHEDVHDYEVASEVLQADLLINFSKPKTHRLAGITAAMKNMVGIAYNKATLPHRTAGSKAEGGDAYLHKNWMKKIAENALNTKIRAEEKGNVLLATLMRYCYGAFLVAGRILGKDKYYIGSWYGNDTIWRTVVDLNYIVHFADKEGLLHDNQQRKILCLADMIIAGEGNGPVRPEPKKLGIICGALNEATLDSVICNIMGFNIEKIPFLREITKNNTWIEYENPIMLLNGEEALLQSWKFKPHDAWKEVLA